MISRWSRTPDAGIWIRAALLAGLVTALGLIAVFWGDSGRRIVSIADVVPPSRTFNIWLGLDGEPSDVVELSGAGHCGWQSATFITLGPLRRYVLDPEDVVPPRGGAFLGGRPPRIEVSLPTDAKYTGFHHDDREIWVSPADGDDAIYVVSPEVTQRWPRNLAGCA